MLIVLQNGRTAAGSLVSMINCGLEVLALEIGDGEETPICSFGRQDCTLDGKQGIGIVRHDRTW